MPVRKKYKEGFCCACLERKPKVHEGLCLGCIRFSKRQVAWIKENRKKHEKILDS